MTDKYSQPGERGQWEEVDERPLDDEKSLAPYFYIDKPV